MFVVIQSEEAEVYCDSFGDCGDPIKFFENEDDAVSFAEDVAYDYYYGVEIVDESVWEMI